jgi:predicted metal-dependent HD superfamily phosphohydrolase
MRIANNLLSKNSWEQSIKKEYTWLNEIQYKEN